ncbi:MAG: phosphoglycerate kinase [Candidatus Berkelbacteria bacterium]|nr:phosphoglycerate kinase [Candidatus Berkelbacteria bacterium]
MAELSKRIVRVPPHRQISKADFRLKRVLIRFDLNVPVEKGEVQDEKRIEAAMPTLKKVMERGAKEIIVISHLGRPEGKRRDEFSLRPVAQIIAKRLRSRVKPKKIETEIDSPALKEYFELTPRVKLFENLRFDPGEESNSASFAKKLASLADIFVQDAFANIHREHTSMVGLPELLPTYAGLLLEKEVYHLMKILNNPDRPFVTLIGGAKVADKLPIIEAFSKIAEAVLVAGKTANEYILEGHPRTGDIYLPTDGISKLGSIVPINEQTLKSGIFDVGPQTIMLYKSILASAKTIFWNGNLGMTENKRFIHGTYEIARFIGKLKAHKVASGGNTDEVISALNLTDQYSFVSTGGGATSDFIAGKKLLALELLLR